MKNVTYKGRNVARPFSDRPDIEFTPDNPTIEVSEEHADTLSQDGRFDVEGHDTNAPPYTTVPGGMGTTATATGSDEDADKE